LKIFWADVRSDQSGKISSGILGIQNGELFQSRNFADGFIGSDEVVYKPLRAKVHRNGQMQRVQRPEPTIEGVSEHELLGGTKMSIRHGKYIAVAGSDMGDHALPQLSGADFDGENGLDLHQCQPRDYDPAVGLG
jgi:hypothetical protein